jgi:hypothetical protein
VPSYNIALIYAGLGELDSAFEWLERACDERNGNLAFMKVDATLDPLRSDPRFQNVLRRVGLAK